MENKLKINNDGAVFIKQAPAKTLITISLKKEKWKENYSLRTRIGIRILQLLQVAELVWE